MSIPLVMQQQSADPEDSLFSQQFQSDSSQNLPWWQR